MSSRRGCAIPGCPKPYYAKGLCMKHRERERGGMDRSQMKPIRPLIDNLARDPEGHKQCSGCRDWHPLSSFTSNRSARDGLNQRCRGCCAAQKLLSRYGMTLDLYVSMLAVQGGVCAACGVEPGRTRLHVDHDHRCCPGDTSCGKCVRGLLCGTCNRAVGLMDDDPVRLRSAADYLERTR